MIVKNTRFDRAVLVRLNPGDDLLLGLRRAVAEAGIANGVILGGVGSLSAYQFHVVSTVALPPENAFVRGEGPFDILTVTGGILGGRVHAHVTFSDTKVAMGGHLEEGCTVLTFAIVCVAPVPEVDLAAWDTVGPLEQ